MGQKTECKTAVLANIPVQDDPVQRGRRYLFSAEKTAERQRTVVGPNSWTNTLETLSVKHTTNFGLPAHSGNLQINKIIILWKTTYQLIILC